MAPPAKKSKLAQKYREDYKKRWPFIHASRQSDEFAFCSICCCDIKISHGGANDIEKHVGRGKHLDAVKVRQQSNKLTNFVKKTEEVDPSILAECLFTKFLVEHNIPLAAAAHAGPLFRKMFPDSNIAKHYGSGATKSTAISNSFGRELSSNLASEMRHKPFSLSTDGSNDKGAETLYPIVIRYFNESAKKVVSEVLTLAPCKESSTGENIFKLIDNVFQERQIDWKNCISFGCDNASVMVGLHKGVAAFIHKKNPSVLIQGCPCHLLHIAAKNANKQLSADCELALIDIYHYFDKSTKRQQQFIQVLEETETAVHKILQYGPTRWLSLHKCIERLLEQWTALSTYFSSPIDSAGNKGNVRFQRIRDFLLNPLSKAYCLFLSATLPIFIEANAFLQGEEPLLNSMQFWMC